MKAFVTHLNAAHSPQAYAVRTSSHDPRIVEAAVHSKSALETGIRVDAAANVGTVGDINASPIQDDC